MTHLQMIVKKAWKLEESGDVSFSMLELFERVSYNILDMQSAQLLIFHIFRNQPRMPIHFVLQKLRLLFVPVSVGCQNLAIPSYAYSLCIVSMLPHWHIFILDVSHSCDGYCDTTTILDLHGISVTVLIYCLQGHLQLVTIRKSWLTENIIYHHNHHHHNHHISSYMKYHWV